MNTVDLFTLSIELGNEAMQTPEDVARALRQLAGGFDTWHCWPDPLNEGVVDTNGNGVGRWEAS